MELKPEEISSILVTKIQEDIKANNNATNKEYKNIFVFPTDVVMRSWIDYLINPLNKCGIEAVPLEQFTAWDTFKKTFVSAKKEGETVIPSILRKMFVTSFIAENATLPKEERLQVIINPDDTYASEADSFSDSLSKNLKTLHFWKKKIEEKGDEYGELDEEDKDFDKLYNAYSKFLADNHLFEPSWINDIEFSEKNKVFHIFYPELLEDFSDYKDTFKNIDNIVTYTFPKNTPSPFSYFYKDSRSELRQTILSIINLVKKGKADWSEIVLSVPNLDVYRPYLERELTLYGVPYVIKAGTTLTRNSAGRIFREIYNCYNENFSFDTVRALLLDKCVPWKDKYIKTIEDLIREGSNMRCICSMGDVDTWNKALFTKVKSEEYLSNYQKYTQEERNAHLLKKNYYDNLLHFYNGFKNKIKAFFSEDNNTFKNINTSWMSFRNMYLKDTKEFSEYANNILSRCITELSEIIQIEEKYKDIGLVIPSPYTFFLSELDKKTYTKQTTDKGLTVFPYRLSAAAYYKYQFVIDASQKNLDINYKRLTYLNNTKRSKLGLINDDRTCNAGEVFIKLYAKNTTGENENIVHFSASENTFNGFAIPHSKLVIKKEEENPNFDDMDYILKEKKYLSSPLDNKEVTELTSLQKESYQIWKSSLLENKESNEYPKILKEDIKNVLVNRRDAPNNNNDIKITARGDLEKFFPCPRRWLLENPLKIEEDTLDTRLMQNYDMGNLNHKVLEFFMKRYKNKKLPFYDEKEEKFFNRLPSGEKEECSEEIKNHIFGENNVVQEAISEDNKIRFYPLVKFTLNSQAKLIGENIYAFLKYLLIENKSAKNASHQVKKMSGLGSCTVMGFEQVLMQDTEKKDISYYGIIDFFALSPEGNIIIIDYKNSKSSIPSQKNVHIDSNGILGDFQMPLYYELVTKQYNKEIEAGYFYSISTKESQVVTDFYADVIKEENLIKKAKKDNTEVEKLFDKDLIESRNALKEYIDIFSLNISKLNFIPNTSWNAKDKMNVKTYKNCIKCPFKNICRTTYEVAGKEITEKAKEEKINE